MITYDVAWSNVRAVDPCWYFSGPSGRDSPLGTELRVRVDAESVLTWGKATFRGTWGSREIDVTRHARHDYEGAWIITERLVGTRTAGRVRATYTYAECEVGSACTDARNHCSIHATVDLVERR